MKIAITGANGFVGHSLLNHFSRRGHTAIALIRKSAQISIDSCEVRELDYEDPSALSAALADVDVLVHNAGKTKTLEHSQMIAANVGLTQKIVAALNAIQRPVQLIYISSQAASAPSSLHKMSTEADAVDPLTAYGKSKAIAERLIVRDCRQPFSIIRPCPIYGPQDKDFLQLFKLCRFGLSMQIGRQERYLNMIHVSQLGDFLLKVAGNPQAYGEVFFATDNQVYTQAQIAAVICKAMGKRQHHIIVPELVARAIFLLSEYFGHLSGKAMVLNRDKLAEILAEAWLADSGKAQALLAWQPEARLPELILETYQWYVQASWL